MHVALDLASAVRRVTVQAPSSSERLVLNAGALRIVGKLGDKPINPAKLSISIFVPEPGNSEAKLVLAGSQGRRPDRPAGRAITTSSRRCSTRPATPARRNPASATRRTRW